MTASSVPRSCAMYPFTASTRFGIKSYRRVSCTSICEKALRTRLRKFTRLLYIPMAQNTMTARMTNVTIVPMSALLGGRFARSIRRARWPRQSIRALFVAWVLSGAAASAHAGWVGEAVDLMGTRVSVELWHDDEVAGRALVAEVLDEYRRIDRVMSTYKPDSEISALNAQAAAKP